MTRPDETEWIHPSPAYPPPVEPYHLVPVSLHELLPMPDGVTDAQRRAVEWIRDMWHPDTLRRKPPYWVADVWDGHAHVDFLREAGKSWIAEYVEDFRRRVGAIEDDGED